MILAAAARGAVGFALSFLGSMQAGLFHKIGTKKLRPLEVFKFVFTNHQPEILYICHLWKQLLHLLGRRDNPFLHAKSGVKMWWHSLTHLTRKQ